MNKLTFNEVKEKNIQILKQYVPIVARVHGANHEEFYEVQKVFEVILEKLKNNKLDLNNEFSKLKEIEIPKSVTFIGNNAFYYTTLHEKVWCN